MIEPRTIGELKNSRWAEAPLRGRTVREEIRSNLLKRLESGGPLFPGIVGYEDTIVPQIINALLARHHFILLGLRGQAKSRILRDLTTLLDEKIPIIAGSEVNDVSARLGISRYSVARIKSFPIRNISLDGSDQSRCRRRPKNCS